MTATTKLLLPDSLDIALRVLLGHWDLEFVIYDKDTHKGKIIITGKFERPQQVLCAVSSDFPNNYKAGL